MTELEQSYEDLQNQMIETKKELQASQRSFENIKKQFFESGERYKANLRAIHYLLSQLADVGTHHEKEVVIRYIKSVLQKDIMTKTAYYPEADELPF